MQFAFFLHYYPPQSAQREPTTKQKDVDDEMKRDEFNLGQQMEGYLECTTFNITFGLLRFL